MTLPPASAVGNHANIDVRRVLQPGEILLWEGAPEPGFRLGGKATGQIALGLPFLAIGVILLLLWIETLQIPRNSAMVVAVLACVFGGAGGYLVFDPLFAVYKTARHVRYALSDRAAFIIRDWPIRRLEMYPILPFPAAELKTGGKVDTVWFHTRTEEGAEQSIVTTRIGFQHIANAAAVLGLVHGIQTGDTE